MVEISAFIAIMISLAGLWLASQAHNQVNSSFKEFTDHMANEVHEAQEEFKKEARSVNDSFDKTTKSIDELTKLAKENSKSINTLSQRITVLEKDLSDLKASIPPQFLQNKKQKHRPA